MGYAEELKLIQKELLDETERAYVLDEGVQGKDGPGSQYLHQAVATYNRKLQMLQIKYKQPLPATVQSRQERDD